MSVGHLYVFFVKMSIQILCPFFNWVVFLFFFKLINLFLAALGLCCCGFSLVEVSRGYSSLLCAGFSLRWLLSSPSTGSSSCGSRALEHRLSSCGAQAWLLRGMWDLPRPGIEPMSLALAGGFLTTAPPGKSQGCLFFDTKLYEFFVYLGY